MFTTHVTDRDFISILFFSLVITSAIFFVLSLSPEEPHLLVGYGCEGSNGQPMYYTEEGDFPPCSLIERSSWRNSVAVESAR